MKRCATIKSLRIHADDNVLIALDAARIGDVTRDDQGEEISLVTEVPRYHKLAAVNLPKGTTIVKYGVPIGVSTQDISKGAHVHIHNLDSVDSMYEHVGGKE